MQGLPLAGWLDKGGDQHVVFGLGVGPGVGEGEVEAKLAEPLLIVRMHHLQMGEGVGSAVIAVAGAGCLQRIEGHAGGAIADAVHMDAKARLIELPYVAVQIGGSVVDQPIAAGILAVGGDGDLLATLIRGEVGCLVVGQHASVWQEGGRAEVIPFQYPVEEDLDRIGLDQGIAGELVAHPVRLGQMAADIELAAVVILVKTGGGGDPHIEQPLIFHLPQAIADKVGGAGILNAGDAARGHQGRDGGQDLAILVRRLFVTGAEQAAIGVRGWRCGLPRE